MRIIVDTNIIVSGIFFSGPPFDILKAWRDGHIQFVLSPEILDEYYKVVKSLANRFPSIEAEAIITLVAANSDIVQSPALPTQVCHDPDDDKFLACALAGNVKMIVSGDKHLLSMTGYRNISILSPGRFVAEYLKGK